MSCANADPRKPLALYFAAVYLVVLAIVASCLSHLESASTGSGIFVGTTIVCYSLVYLLPATCVTAALYWRLRPRTRSRTLATGMTAVLLGSGTELFLAGDRYLYSLYGYHFNSSVWNLIITPGGIDSLGSTDETKFWLGMVVLLTIAGNAGLLWLFTVRPHRIPCIIPPRRVFIVTASLLVLGFTMQEAGYAYARYANNEAILRAASIVPLRLDTTAVKLFKAAGVPRPPMQERIRVADGRIQYPLQPLQSQPLKKYPNIVWLTAESFRSDLFSPEITPNLWRFSKRAATFNQHYSGGNRTRMGMFSMFYGLYAPYWYGFQEQKVAPLLMKQVADHNYQLAINTSQSFSYPELRDTVFAGIPKENLQELQQGPSWQRDRENIGDIVKFIQTRDPDRPFFSFMFFESTHAPYNFPDSAVIRDDYLRQVNYLQFNNFTGNIEQLHNRYVNAAHHVDTEVGRVLDFLEQEQLLDDTIVLFTGDHGEEFMENGHWGHGHNEVFPETQIRVPLVLWIPGQQPRQIDYPTSHNQIPATILPLLGVTSPPQDYASEEGLFAASRPYRVIGSYDYLGIVDDKGKLSFPFTTADYFHYVYSDSRDNVLQLQQQQQLLQAEQPQLEQVLGECRRFTARPEKVAAVTQPATGVN